MSHDHTHEHYTPNAQSFEEKLIRLLEHWIRHNEDHVKTYREWADQARNHHLHEAASRIEESAVMAEAVTKKLEQTLSAAKRLNE
ncbi:MAG: hypothetical protein COS92_04900 [Desulfobacterales bacterium CG07_land_8_20_14_0_80_52_14]|nr:MAG: hypothetical protein COX20_07680 [Desulfobacterales bacterium CG23_combo_of_CG06-09_8_20_14_all_52_9]PIU49758.1 MAG: hypothetical protein COS92_04900 [Desulfobacterales bacterium CG07_land_8_20_14_0_80_52_14]